MWADDPSARQIDAFRVAGGVNAARQSPFSQPYNPNREAPGWWDSFGAAAVRDNTILSGANDYVTRQGAEGDDTEMFDFNPYGYLQDTYEREDLEDVYPFILDGELNNARTEREVEAILADIREERARSETASANPFAGLHRGCHRRPHQLHPGRRSGPWAG